MEFDLSSQPEIVQTIAGYALQGWDLATGWLLSPAAWSQFALLLVAYLAAILITRRARPALARLLDPGAAAEGAVPQARRFVQQLLPLMLPLLAFVLTSAGESAVRAMFDSGAVIAFGKRVFLFLAVRAFVRDIISDPFLKLLGRYILVPVAALYTLGLLSLVAAQLEATIVPLGNMSFNLLWMVQFVVVGGVIFWLGQWSNGQSTDFIAKQADMRPSLRQLLAKSVEFLIFAVAFLVLMNIMGVNLSALAVLGGAIGVGLGFGLQKIASNFISGVILLVEGQATVGDYVEFADGEAGTIVKMTARAAILETFDGRWIVVPNEDFIVSRVTNYSDAGSAKRYEVPFSVSYDADLEQVCEIINEAVAGYAHVLLEPERPDTEIRAFGDSGIEMAVEFWCNGLDDGPNRFTADVFMIVWKTLKAEGIEIPFPQRVVELKQTSSAQ
ncbi:MAG: mechanosensitive ion channel domain-containing protein [Pseudomonadota bacterium]